MRRFSILLLSLGLTLSPSLMAAETTAKTKTPKTAPSLGQRTSLLLGPSYIDKWGLTFGADFQTKTPKFGVVALLTLRESDPSADAFRVGCVNIPANDGHDSVGATVLLRWRPWGK